MAKATRREALLGGAALLAAPAIIERAGAQSAFDWRRFRGERIEGPLDRSLVHTRPLAGEELRKTIQRERPASRKQRSFDDVLDLGLVH